jgi:hypothetical protein
MDAGKEEVESKRKRSRGETKYTYLSACHLPAQPLANASKKGSKRPKCWMDVMDELTDVCIVGVMSSVV